MKIEQQYYELESFWHEDSFTKQDRKRISFVASIIPNNVKTILDIGCGRGELLELLKKEKKYERLHGADRSQAALKQVKSEKSLQNIESMRFSDNEFDLVTSLEVIEHIPHNVYQKALREIARVARKYILITVPNNEKLGKNIMSCPLCLTCFNPEYHVRSFNSVSMVTLFREYGFKNLKLSTIGDYKRYYLITSIREAISRSRNIYPIDVICPLCGYTIKSTHSLRARDSHPDQGNHPLKNIIKKIWPAQIVNRWIVGLYSREK